MQKGDDRKVITFYVLLTVHIGMILVNNQLDAQFLCTFISFSTCFGQPCAHHQENYCINATSGLCHSVYMIVWYAGAYASAYQAVIMLHPVCHCVDDRLVCRSICSCIPDGHNATPGLSLCR